MQIACKYRSLSRYRSKRSLSLGILLSRYVFFSHSHCTCSFPPGTLCSFSLFRTFGHRVPKRRNQSRDKVSAHEVAAKFFLIPRPFASSVQPLVEVKYRWALYWYSGFRRAPRYRRIYETPYVVGVEYTGKKKNISSCIGSVFSIWMDAFWVFNVYFKFLIYNNNSIILYMYVEYY